MLDLHLIALNQLSVGLSFVAKLQFSSQSLAIPPLPRAEPPISELPQPGGGEEVKTTRFPKHLPTTKKVKAISSYLHTTEASNDEAAIFCFPGKTDKRSVAVLLGILYIHFSQSVIFVVYDVGSS